MSKDTNLPRGELGIRMLCAWNNIPRDKAPASWSEHHNEWTREAWARVADAAIASQKAEIERLRPAGLEFMEAAEAVFDWMNGNDLSADHEEQHPDDFKRVSKALVAFRAALSETSNGKD